MTLEGKWGTIEEDMAANLFDFWAHRERLVGAARERAWKAEKKTFMTVAENQLYFLKGMGVLLEAIKTPIEHLYDVRAKFRAFYSTR